MSSPLWRRACIQNLTKPAQAAPGARVPRRDGRPARSVSAAEVGAAAGLVVGNAHLVTVAVQPAITSGGAGADGAAAFGLAQAVLARITRTELRMARTGSRERSSCVKTFQPRLSKVAQ